VSRLLLDTHVWLWMLAQPERLPEEVRAQLADLQTELLLSAASAWEIAIKVRLGRLELPGSPRDYVPDRLRRSGVQPLAVELDHALRVAELPEHHRDPFDRVLIAQAQALDLVLVTADRQLDAYDVRLLRV
jgi:PIN domain nuclease of toxin-antitoxin system